MAEWNHESVWGAIDALADAASAESIGARQEGRPRRHRLQSVQAPRPRPDKRPRWPSTELIAKMLAATGETLENFVGLARGKEPSRSRAHQIGRHDWRDFLAGAAPRICAGRRRRLLRRRRFSAGTGLGRDRTSRLRRRIRLCAQSHGRVRCCRFYRDGDVIIVSPTARVRRGDRVVVKTHRRRGDGEGPETPERHGAGACLVQSEPCRRASSPARDVDWVARILWASQ